MGKVVVLILLSLTVALLGQYFLKIGMNSIGEISLASAFSVGGLIKIFSNISVIAGFICYVFSAITWLVVLSQADLSFAYPFVGITYIVVLFMSQYALGENITPIRWLGAFIIFLGIIIVSRT